MNPARLRISSRMANATIGHTRRLLDSLDRGAAMLTSASGILTAPGPKVAHRPVGTPGPLPSSADLGTPALASAARGAIVLRRLSWLVPAFLFTLMATLAGPALASEQNGYSMEILVDGVPVRELPHGATYIEATPGREYSVRLTNHTGARIAIALAVDGLNSIDAKTTGAREASKWILGPWESITIDGWQTSLGSARRFFFTTEDRSYGAWLGKTRNLGVITAAVFRERPRIPIYSRMERWRGQSGSAPEGSANESRRRDDNRAEAPREAAKDAEPTGGKETSAQTAAPAGAPAGAPAPRSEGSSDVSGGAESGSSNLTGKTDTRSSPAPSTLGERKAARQALSDELAATGIGRELTHPVERVAFEAESSPSAILEVRYEYRDALVRLGVLPRPLTGCDDPLARREDARGFTDEGFAPDPFRRGR